MDSKVLVDALFLRSVMPMMISGHNQELLQPFCVGTEVAMCPGRVKSDKDQIGEDDALRKAQHQGSENETSDKCVIHEVGA